MSKPLRVLAVDDSDDDAELNLLELRRGGYQVASRCVQTADSMRSALQDEAWDVVLCDYSMPEFDALSAFSVLKASGLDLPFLIVSGTIAEEAAVDALKAGVHDFLVKGRLARLIPAIERELREVDIRRQRHQTEQALRESELKYRRIVETAQEGIWVLDANNRTTYVNRRMAEMLGPNAEELIGASLFEFMDEEWKQVALRNMERLPQSRARQHELKLRRRNGSEFWASLSSNAITDDAGSYAGSLLMVSDVTDQHKLQEQLMVSDRMVSVGTLAAGVAHEINNPLACVLANLELGLCDLGELSRDLGESALMQNLREELSDAREATERVRNIVRDLKLFSRTEEEKRGAVEVQRVLESAARMAWSEVRHRAHLVKDYQPVPAVNANESRLGQVFLNLIVNAAQAIPEGRADSNEIRIATALAPDGRVMIEVRDSGSGIPREVVGRLFMPFFTTKPPGFGTGLGLSICHRIITSLGGEISVETEVGKGSAFRVFLPATKASISESTPPSPSVAGASRRGRILVIDDEPLVAKVIQRTLSREHDVVTTQNAEEALRKLSEGLRFDVILCDLMMPSVTGMDFHEELLRLAPDHADRVIFLTGGPFTARGRTFFDEVPNLRIEKPFDPAALRAIVNERIK